MFKLSSVSFTAVRQPGFGGLVLFTWAALKYVVPLLFSKAFSYVARGTISRDVSFSAVTS
jgi:hypothetical protein